MPVDDIFTDLKVKKMSRELFPMKKKKKNRKKEKKRGQKVSTSKAVARKRCDC